MNFCWFPRRLFRLAFLCTRYKENLYISYDAVFDEDFTSPLSMPQLPFQGALRLRGTSNHVPNTETLIEITGPPSGHIESYPDNLILNPYHHKKKSSMIMMTLPST